MVELARTEEAVKNASITALSLSDAALSCADTFIPLAESVGKSLTAEITPGVEIRGFRTTCSACSPSCWTTL